MCFQTQFCIQFYQFYLYKKNKIDLIFKGRRDSGKGVNAPPPPPQNEILASDRESSLARGVTHAYDTGKTRTNNYCLDKKQEINKKKVIITTPFHLALTFLVRLSEYWTILICFFTVKPSDCLVWPAIDPFPLSYFTMLRFMVWGEGSSNYCCIPQT